MRLGRNTMKILSSKSTEKRTLRGTGCGWEDNIRIQLLIENKLIICALGNFHYKISREKFEPEPGFEPWTSGFLTRRSNTWAILVLMPVHVLILE